MSINDSVVATVSGATFTGTVKFNAGLSGSLTQLTNGTSYLIAGTNIDITTGSSGAVTISNTAPRFYQWNELSPSPALNTTASISIAGALGSAYNVTSVGSDVYFFVSGSTSSTYGASVFGGDFVVSGTLEAHTITNFSTNNTTSALTLNGSTRGSTATGKGVAVTAAVGTTSVGGGTVTLTAGNSGGASSNAGGITLSAGSSSSSAAAGDISISAGDTSSTTAGTRGGNITLAAGSIPSGGTGTAGNVSITTGAQANVGGTPGNITLTAQRSKIIMRRSTATAPAGTDVFLYVTGTIGDTDKSVFAGDMVVSGTVRSFTGFSGSLTRLTDGSSYLIAGSNIAITTGSNGAVTVATTGLAPSTSAFLTVGNDATLTNERSLTAGTGLTATDGGANSTYSFAINDSVVATVSGTTFTGATKHNAGLSGSLTKLTDGTSYLIAGSNVTITTGSNGSVTIASTATGGGSGISYFDSTTAGSIYTTGSAAFKGGEVGIVSPSNKGTDVFFYVSGSSSSKSLFGGDVRISGSLVVGTGSVTITSNDVQFGSSVTRIENNATDLKFFDVKSPSGKSLSDLVSGSGVLNTPQYLVLAANDVLTNERVFTAGTGISVTDGGAGNSYTVAINDSIVATVSGTTFTGLVKVNGGLSGSLTSSNVTAGQVVVAGTGGVLSGSNNFWWDNTNGRVGIGTNTPTGILQVSGGTAAASTNGTNITIQAQSGGSGTSIGGNILLLPGTGAGGGGSHGAVGLGTASPGVWGSSGGTQAYVLQIGINGRTSLGDFSNDLQLTNNALFPNSGVWQRIGAAAASNYYQTGGTHGWRVAASSTAGSNISWTTAMLIDNSGNVGIGTASPTSRLEIVSSSTGDNANILTLRNSAYNVGESASLLFAHGGAPTSRISSYLPGSNQSNLTFHTSDTSSVLQQRMTIDGSGNVGIGTATPASRLTIQAAEGEGIVLQRPGSSPTHLKISTTAGGISPNYTTTYDTINTEMVFASATSGGTGGNIIFSTNTSGTATERLRITPDGNIGIGTSTTSDKLAVNGSLSVTGSTLPGASNTYDLGSSSKLWSTVYATSLTGSLTKLSDGTSALIAGTNVTITTGSNGSVTISSTGGGGSGTPGGSDTQVQFNDGGSFGGDPDFTFTKASNLLRVANISGSITASNVTAGQVVVAGTGGVLSGSNNFFWDNTNSRVGIGTSNPQVSFHVGEGSDAPAISNTSLLVSNAGTTNLAVRDATNNVELMNYAYSGGGLVGTATNHSYGIRTNNATRMTIDTSGNVGIGTGSPASQLHVFNSSTSLNMLVETTSAPSNSGFYLRHPSNDGYLINRGDLSLFLFDATAWPILIRTLAAQPVSIHTNGTERLRVTSGGNVGIGGTNPISRFEVTGSTGDSSAAALHLVNASGASIFYARNDQYIGVGTSTLTSGRSITTAADIEVYGVRVGRGAGGVSDNTAVGASALNANTTGVENTAFGNNSLAANLGGSSNTAVGCFALLANTSGIENTAIGRAALYSNTVGGRNTAIGRASLANMINGSYNTAVGVNALINATSSSENTALGYGPLWYSTGGNNTAVGSLALYGVSGQSTATNNTAIGIYAGYSVTSGGSNFFGGREAGYSSSIAENNVLIGYRAGYLITSGSNNVAIGYEALRNSSGNGSNGRTNVAVGTAAMYSATTAVNCVAVGWNAGYSYVSADSSTSVGIYSAYYQTGDNNTAIGRMALQGSSGLSTGAGNTAIGRNAGYSLTTGNYNFFGGYEAGFYITSGSNNVVIGYNAQAGGWADSNSIVIGQGAVGLGTNTTVLGHSSTTLTSIPAGNVGIGTTLLDSKLVVNGNSVFSGSVNPSADNTYDLGSSTKRWANVNATNVVSSGSLGISYAQTSTDGTTAIFDTITLTSFTGGAVYELMILANPNVGGSGAYRDVVYGKVIVGTGYNGAAVTTYIQYVNESPAPRSLYPTSGGPITADVVFLQSGSEKTDVASGTTATIRVKVSGYGGTVGAGTTVRLKLLISG